MSTIGNEAVSKNSGADVGIRRRINFIEGVNVTLTIADDPANHEIDVTIASAGAGATAWTKHFYPAVNPDSAKGTYAAVLMTDGLELTVRQTFAIPTDLTTITTAAVVVIPEGTGNLRRSVATTFAGLCANEQFGTHTDTIAESNVVVTDDEVECLDITAALTLATGGDIVGIEFTRHGDDALDTVDGDVYYLGIYIEGDI